MAKLKCGNHGLTSHLCNFSANYLIPNMRGSLDHVCVFCFQLHDCACKIEILFEIACFVMCSGCGFTWLFRVFHTLSNRHKLQGAGQTHSAGSYWFKKMYVGGICLVLDLHRLFVFLLHKLYVRYYIRYYNTFFWLWYCLFSCTWQEINIPNMFFTLIWHNAEVFTSDTRFVLPGDPVIQLLYA